MDLGSCESLNIIDNEMMSMKTKELAVGHIIFNTLRALSAVHNNLFIHNDIKPANILSNKYGEIKLSDFGTVIKLKKESELIKNKNNGTQRYQSPEKMVKHPIKFNTKTDIWSVGVTAYELLFGDTYNAEDELAFINNTPKLTPKTHRISSACCDFINKCLIDDYKARPSADELLEHAWFSEHIIKTSLHFKWPWLIEIQCDEHEHDILAAFEKMESTEKNKIEKKKSKKKVAFADSVNGGNGIKKRNQYYNEDLLFMISALIIYYSTQNVNLDQQHNNPSKLHRRRSAQNLDQSVGKTYSDETRINNIAKYALCSRQMVVERIRVTVAHIKSQITSL